jgi:hypothetical protein
MGVRKMNTIEKIRMAKTELGVIPARVFENGKLKDMKEYFVIRD